MGYVRLTHLAKLRFVVKPQSEASHYPGKIAARTGLSYLNGLAVVSKTIYPHQRGRVYLQGSWWPAICEQNLVLLPDTTVFVTGISGITLIVRPNSDFM